MGVLDSLLQGGPDCDDYQDFVDRYDQGPPYAGISDDEAIGRYQQVAPELSPDAYQQSAQDALGHMAPEERAQFGQLLQQRAQQQGVDLPGLGQARRGAAAGFGPAGPAAGWPAPAAAGHARSAPRWRWRRRWPAGRREWRSRGMLGNPLAKAALAAIAAMAAKRMLR